MIEILYLSPGPVPPVEDPRLDKFHYLSGELGGDVLWPVWGDPASNDYIPTRGDFRHHFVFYDTKLSPARLSGRCLAFYFSKGRELYRSGRRFNVIVNCGAGKNLLSSILLKWVTGAKLIVEVRGHPTRGMLFGDRPPGLKEKAKVFAIKTFLRMTLRFADRIKLLYPTQLDDVLAKRPANVTVFHDFAALSLVPPASGTARRVLFMGWPWYLKGVDVLVRAFASISPRFPDVELLVVGGCKDRAPYERLAGGNPRIIFSDGVKYDEALRLVSTSTLLVLPSRTEAMGRVLLEAMASGIPVVASRVDGIPFYVRDGVDGYLFESERSEELAEKMATLLADSALAARMGAAGRERAITEFGERRFAELYAQMVRQTVEERS